MGVLLVLLVLLPTTLVLAGNASSEDAHDHRRHDGIMVVLAVVGIMPKRASRNPSRSGTNTLTLHIHRRPFDIRFT